jgi:hypothetical protein
MALLLQLMIKACQYLKSEQSPTLSVRVTVIPGESDKHLKR